MLYTDSGSPIPNDKPMEQFKASDGDWQSVKKLSEDFSDKICCTILELRDRLAELEKKARTAEECNDAICRRLDEIRRKEPAAAEESSPDRVLVRSQTGEYLRAGTPLYLDSRNRLVSYSVGEARPWKECGKDHAVPSPAAAPAAAVPSDQELWEVQLKVKSLSRPHIGWQVWSPESEPLIAAHRALYNYGYERGQTDGYEQGLAAGRAEQQATKAVRVVLPETPCYPDLVSGGAYYLHGYDDAWAAARAMVEQQQAAQSDPGMATPEPEPSPSPATKDGLLVAALDGIGLDNQTVCRTLLTVAGWLRSRGNHGSAVELEREANR